MSDEHFEDDASGTLTIHLKDQITELRKQLAAQSAVVEAISLKHFTADMLLKKAAYLKTTDGEGWAIGEMVERAVKLQGSEDHD